MIPLIKKMYQSRILNDFMLMLQLISDETLEADNLPLMLAVECAKLQSLENTSAMTYNHETLDFWEILENVSWVRLTTCFWQKNAGQVKTGECQPGYFDPEKSSFNFAGPSIKTILQHHKEINKVMYAGIIDGCFDLVNTMKQYVLEYDAKRIASGLADNDIRDVNLWGYEGPPSLTVAQEQLNEEMALIEKLQTLEEKYDPTLLPELRAILINMTLRIKCKRYSILGHKNICMKSCKCAKEIQELQKNTISQFSIQKATYTY